MEVAGGESHRFMRSVLSPSSAVSVLQDFQRHCTSSWRKHTELVIHVNVSQLLGAMDEETGIFVGRDAREARFDQLYVSWVGS